MTSISEAPKPNQAGENETFGNLLSTAHGSDSLCCFTPPEGAARSLLGTAVSLPPPITYWRSRDSAHFRTRHSAPLAPRRRDGTRPKAVSCDRTPSGTTVAQRRRRTPWSAVTRHRFPTRVATRSFRTQLPETSSPLMLFRTPCPAPSRRRPPQSGLVRPHSKRRHCRPTPEAEPVECGDTSPLSHSGRDPILTHMSFRSRPS